jgi:hypothetical protein
MRTDRQLQDALDQDEQQEDQDSSSGFGSTSSPSKVYSIEKDGDVRQEVQQQDARDPFVTRPAQNDVQHKDVQLSRVTPLEKMEVPCPVMQPEPVQVQQQHVRSSAVMLPGKHEVFDSRYLAKPLSEDCRLLIEWASEFKRPARDDGDGDEKRGPGSAKGCSSTTTIASIRDSIRDY